MTEVTFPVMDEIQIDLQVGGVSSATRLLEVAFNVGVHAPTICGSPFDRGLEVWVGSCFDEECFQASLITFISFTDCHTHAGVAP
jgi:hypothetical protein